MYLEAIASLLYKHQQTEERVNGVPNVAPVFSHCRPVSSPGTLWQSCHVCGEETRPPWHCILNMPHLCDTELLVGTMNHKEHGVKFLVAANVYNVNS